MNIMELLEQTKDQATVGRVFGEPITRGDVTIIPVARIAQGAGGGMGQAKEFEGSGSGGGGFGIAAKPAGIYVIKDGEVHWKPAIDVNRIVLGGQLVGVVLLLTVRTVVRLIARRKRK